MAEVAGAMLKSARTITISKMVQQNAKITCPSSYYKRSIYKISNKSDETAKTLVDSREQQAFRRFKSARSITPVKMVETF